MVPGIRFTRRSRKAVVTRILLSLSFALPFGSARGSTSSAAENTSSALRLLSAHCLSCHDEEKRKGGVSMATREGLLEGGDNGAAITPGSPDDSLLIKVLAPDADPHMPPKGQLAPGEIDILRQWIAAGAEWDQATIAKARAPRQVNLEELPSQYRPVHALALDPADQRLAAGHGRTLVLFDLQATNHPVQARVEAHRDLVRAVAWSPDGKQIATGAFGEVMLWDAETLTRVWSVTNLPGRVTALQFTPHGGALVVAEGLPAERGWLRLFARETGALMTAWQAHADTVNALALSPDGGVIATAGSDKLVRIWELISQREVARMEGHLGAVSGVAFNRDATELISIGADKQLKLWDVRTREAVVTMQRSHGLSAVAWSADNSRAVASDDDGRLTAFSEFKRHTGEQSSATARTRELNRSPGPLQAVAVSRDGNTVAAGGEDGLIRVISGEGKLVATLDPAAEVTDPAEPESPKPAESAEALAAITGEAEPAPSFVYDILPMLAKAGCSAGPCHAKPGGQNGFHLSVFNYDPATDYAEIVKEGRGRRIFPAAPDESLLLLKPTAAVDHGGGRRLEPDSAEYQLLRRWIRAGMPYQRPDEPTLTAVTVEPREGVYSQGTTQSLTVQAKYSDGTIRDVTHLADYIPNDRDMIDVDDRGQCRVGNLSGECVVVVRFMGMVDAAKFTIPSDPIPDIQRVAALPVSNFIDELANAHFRKLGLLPSDPCTDSQFLRRAYLDVIGVLPTPDEAREFLVLAGKDSRKARADLVERLLSRAEYADYWANKWADLLRPNPDRVGVKSVFMLDQWLREAFRDNLPYDQFARALLLAEGSNHQDGPIVVYRDRRDPPEIATMFSQLFLGVRMECAKCHHHPNEKWSQEDFYQFAAVFGSLDRKGAGLSPPISAGTESFYRGKGTRVKHPVSGQEMSPRPPDGPELEVKPGNDPREAFADWLTDPSNPFFARAAVNRVWASLFGRGFVEPVDDFRISNPAANEPLLVAVAEDFARHGYDFKHLLRTILNSSLYQLSSLPTPGNAADTKNFSRAQRRRLSAEVLLDAINDITGVSDDFNGCPPGTRAMQTWSYKVRSHLMDAFGRPNASSDCPCERDLRTSVVQALHLRNSQSLHEKLRSPQGRVRQLAESEMTAEEIVTELYLAAYSRFPAPDELAIATRAFEDPSATRQTATEDVLWALLNSAEFVFNH